MDFFRFPHTPHVAWLGSGEPRDDKVMAPEEVTDLLAGEVLVEEKVDGANLGISVDDDGEIRAQNRGSWLSPPSCHPQFRQLWAWLAPRRERLVDVLWPDKILFGEWCAAVHSIAYSRLPDWFLAFDVFDRSQGRFVSASRRDALVAGLEVALVPRVGQGRFSVAELRAMLGPSRLADGPAEGVVVRRDAGGFNVARGKLVRPEFVQAIGEHWSRGPLRRNALAVRAPQPPGQRT